MRNLRRRQPVGRPDGVRRVHEGSRRADQPHGLESQ